MRGERRMLRPRGEQSRALTPALPAASQLQDLLSTHPPGVPRAGGRVCRRISSYPPPPPPHSPTKYQSPSKDAFQEGSQQHCKAQTQIN